MQNTYTDTSKNTNAHAVKDAVIAGQDRASKIATRGAEIARTQIDSTQEAVRSGLNIAAASAHRSLSGLQEAFTGEKAKEAMKQSSEHFETITAASAVLSKGFQDISREWMDTAKKGAEKSQEAFHALARCRSPNEFFEIQSRLLKENLGILVDSTRRVAEISSETAKTATQKIGATGTNA